MVNGRTGERGVCAAARTGEREQPQPGRVSVSSHSRPSSEPCIPRVVGTRTYMGGEDARAATSSLLVLLVQLLPIPIFSWKLKETSLLKLMDRIFTLGLILVISQ